MAAQAEFSAAGIRSRTAELRAGGAPHPRPCAAARTRNASAERATSRRILRAALPSPPRRSRSALAEGAHGAERPHLPGIPAPEHRSLHPEQFLFNRDLLPTPKSCPSSGFNYIFLSKIRFCFCFLTVCFGYRMTSFRCPFSPSSLWETLGQNQGEFKLYDGVISERLIPRVRVGQRGSRAAEVRNLALKLMPAGTTCVWFRRVLPGLWISRSKKESYYGGVLIPSS